MDRVDWDTLFMSMAYLVSRRSPDQETQIGAVLVGHDKKILSLGFNGFPRGCKDENLPGTRPGKYFYIVHAESNCLINAAFIPNPESCTIYVTARPCPECTKQIIQHGVGRVVYDSVATNMSVWDEEKEGQMRRMLEGVPLTLSEYTGSKSDIVGLLNHTAEYVKARS